MRRVGRRRQTVIPAKLVLVETGSGNPETRLLRLKGSRKMDSRHTSLLERDSWGKSMKHKAPVFTLALLGALALAAISGGLFPPSGNVVRAQAANSLPVFPNSLDTSLEVDENTPPGVNIGDPYTATDDDEDTLEFGDPLTYSLEGTNAASFDIDESTGQLITKAELHADGDDAVESYTVMVKVEDSRGGEDDHDVVIRVTDVDEPPAAPIAPVVVSGEDDTNTSDVDESTTTLKVIWHEPENMGPSITGYQVQYKKTADNSYTLIDNITETVTTISPQDGLDAATLPTRCGCGRRT